MTTTPSRATFTSRVPAAGPGQDPRNRREQVLVHHLLDELIEGLTDRAGGTHPFPWTPDQEVRVGVLGVTVNTPPPDDVDGASGDDSADDPDDTDEPTDPVLPVENRGVIGVDFVVSGAKDHIELTIDVVYALYHPLLPGFGVVAADAERRDKAAQAKPKTGTRGRRPNVPLSPAWVRDDRHVRFTMRIPVAGFDNEASTADLAGGDLLAEDARAAVDTHFQRADALKKLTRNQTLPVAAALGTEAEFMAAVNERTDRNWVPTWPVPRVTVATTPTVDGELAVSVSIVNARGVPGRDIQDLNIYDARMSVTVEAPARLEPKTLHFADGDPRYADVATVVGRGRGCVAEAGDSPNEIIAQTLPIHYQHVSESLTHDVDITFAALAHNHAGALDAIATAMRAYHRAWDLGRARTDAERNYLEELASRFGDEIDRFELGRDLLQADPRLDRAFHLMNETFAAARPGGAWRLFQLVFIVSELGGLAVRENPADARLMAELDAVDVLWFPTGGGKTEAYLGLIVVALFFDRLRGKERGASAWLLFPLRMLSVQQLARITDVLYHAEESRLSGEIAGDPFTLGYLVGAGNTPNRLERNDPNSWWPGLDTFASWTQEERDLRRLVGACPKCKAGDVVGLDADRSNQRLLHVCRSCGYLLPIYASDEEVTRYQGSVIVSTVDKITAFARNGQLTAFNHGPRKCCPAHGWYTHDKCIAAGCAIAANTHTEPSGFHDPTPSLWIQDELHLVREELGVFAGHYHTLLAELARGADNLPSKVIAATATIEQFEDQLSQVYGRNPRMFPMGGWSLERSFYSETTDDIRRLYLGILPAGGGTVKVDLAGILTSRIVKAIHLLTDDPTPLITSFAAEGIVCTPDEARDLLFDYELALAYVNSKAHGVAIHDDIQRLSEEFQGDGADPVKSEYLMGETTLGELASVVAAIQNGTLSTQRPERIRALVGTSVISHGVDLDRLNFETLAGMPPSYAHYIQATARAGRSHVGLIMSVFDRMNRRETSMFQSFATTHAALERMVEPVPVNRFASRAVERTLPGIVSALLWDETRNPTWGTTDDIGMTRRFRPWWDTNAASLIPRLRARLERAYRCPVPQAAFTQEEQRLVDAALERWETVERQRMQQWQSDWLTDLFTSSAMRSLRDVDRPVEFSGGNRAMQIIDRLQG